MRARRRGLVAAVLMGAVMVGALAGCGTKVGAGATVPTETGPIPWTTFQPSAVTGAHLAADQRTVTLDTQVPDGPHACVRDLTAKLGEPGPGLVRVQVTFSSPSGDRRSGCTKERSTPTRVVLPAPLGERELVVDDFTVFTADGATPPDLRLCGKLGCHPAPTGCTPASYDQALMAVDAPMHTYRDATDCQGTWLVIDFSWRTGPACAGETKDPACSSRLGDRVFFRAETSGWVPIVHDRSGGCAAIHRREPAFPTSMCGPLAPLSLR